MRKTKVVGFSIPPALERKFNAILKDSHKTKSELFREVLDVYFKTAEARAATPDTDLYETDAAKALQAYWNLRKSSKGQVIIVGLGIVERNGKVLIGARKQKDKWVERLTWAFPGGKLDSLDFAEGVQRELLEETGLTVSVENLVAARVHPDSGFKEVQVVALYFHCKVEGKATVRPLEGFKELKWVKPAEVFTYFTTSVSDDVTKFLMMLEKACK